MSRSRNHFRIFGSVYEATERAPVIPVTLASMDEFLDSFSLEHFTNIKISMPIRPNAVGCCKHASFQCSFFRISPACQKFSVQAQKAHASFEFSDIHDSLAIDENFRRLNEPSP